MGISITSLFENNKHIKNLDIYLLGHSISVDNKKCLEYIGDCYHRKIYIIDVPELNVPECLISPRWPLSAFTRLFAGELLPKNINRILYLDCDTIIKGDIQPLENINMDDALFGGIKDCISSLYKKNIGLSAEDVYINAGVLIINLEKLRQQNIRMSVDQYLQKYTSFINYADQDILNGTFRNNIKAVGPEYNLMTIVATYSLKEIETLRRPTNYYSLDELQHAVNNPVIIHYTTNMRTIRPWYKNTNHPYADEFKKYLATSPWSEMNLSEYHFNSRESYGVRLIQLLPNNIANYCLGILHAILRPLYIKLRAKFK